MKAKKMQRLALVAAQPQECSGVLGWPGWERLGKREGVSLYELEIQGRILRLAIGGMGEKRARFTVGHILEGFHATRLISFGFAGALDPALGVGDVVWGGQLLMWRGPGDVLLGPSLDSPWPESGLGQAAVVSVPGFVSKRKVRRDLVKKWLPAVLDLETYGLAQEATVRGIPFSCMRVVSDEWGLDAGLRVREWVDQELRIRPRRILFSLFSKPWDLVLLWKLFARSRVASRALGQVLHRMVMTEEVQSL